MTGIVAFGKNYCFGHAIKYALIKLIIDFSIGNYQFLNEEFFPLHHA